MFRLAYLGSCAATSGLAGWAHRTLMVRSGGGGPPHAELIRGGALAGLAVVCTAALRPSDQCAGWRILRFAHGAGALASALTLLEKLASGAVALGSVEALFYASLAAHRALVAYGFHLDLLGAQHVW